MNLSNDRSANTGRENLDKLEASKPCNLSADNHTSTEKLELQKANLSQISLPSTDNVSSLIELIDTLEKIDTTKPMAKLNKTTISDNNGGRIQL